MPVNVTTWLRGLGLEQYATAFVENEVDELSLPSLTAEDLRDLGVTAIGHRRRLLDAIAALRAETPGADVTIMPARATLQQPDLGTGAAERRLLTVMFCEIAGSTSLSTQIDPENRDLINAYHKVVAETVVSFDGFVAQYPGDGVLIYFGYPQAHEDHAEAAVRAGLAVIHAIAKLSGSVALQVRIGIATGTVVVGDLIGDGGSRELGVVGATPHLAVRVLALAEPNTIVIAERTRRQVVGLFDLEDLGPQELKGFGEPQHAWRVLGESGVASRSETLRSGETSDRRRHRHRRRRHHSHSNSNGKAWVRNLLILVGLVGIIPLLWLAFSKTETPAQNDTATKTAGNASAPPQESTPHDTQSVALEQKAQAARKDTETRMGRVYQRDFENGAVNRTAGNLPLSKQVPIDYKLTAEDVFASRNKGEVQILGPTFNVGDESCKDCLSAEALSESERLRYFGLVRIHRMAALTLYNDRCADRPTGDKDEALAIIENQFKKLPSEIQEKTLEDQIKAIKSRPAVYYTNGDLVAPGGLEWFCNKTTDAINNGDADPMFKTAREGLFPIEGK